MRRPLHLLAFLLLVACFETGLPGERLAASEPSCTDCPAEPTCPSGERCAEYAGLRFRALTQLRTCGPSAEIADAIHGRGPLPPLAVGGTMTLDVSWLRPEDREPGAVVAVADETILSVRELSFDGPSGHAQLVIEGVAAGSANVSIRQVEGDLLIDRTRVTVGAVASVRLVAPGTVGCIRDAQVLLRSVEVAPVVELVASSGALLADESAHVLTADGAPLGPIAADVDRVSLLVVSGGARTPIELDVVDRADRIERASTARNLLVARSRWSTEYFRCYRAVHGEREVVGAAFEFEEVAGEQRGNVEGEPSAPQCLLFYQAPAGAALHVRAAGAERVEDAE